MSESQPSFGPWRLFKIQLVGSPLGRKLYETIVQCSESSLSTVERFEISNYPVSDLGGVKMSDVAKGFRELELSSCSSIRTPLSLLPCFPNIVPRITHLEGWFSVAGPSTLSSCFQGVDLRNLQWLELEVINGNSDYDAPITEDYTVHLPNMNRLTVEMYDYSMTVEALLSLMDRFPCPKLLQLDIVCGILSGDEDVPLSDAIGNLILALGLRFKSIDWLSLHFPMTPQYIKHMVAGFQRRLPGGDVIFRNLRGISVDINENKFKEEITALLTLLQNRKDDNVPIRKLELWMSASGLEDWQQAVVEYLGLFVKDVVLMLRPPGR